MAQNIVSWANRVVKEYAERVAALLGVPVREVKVKIGEVPEGAVAYATDDSIVLDRDYFRLHQDDEGAIVHEMVHVFTFGAYGSVRGRRFEGLADAVRVKLGLTTPGWTPSPVAARMAGLGDPDFQRIVGNMLRASAGLPPSSGQPTASQPQSGGGTSPGERQRERFEQGQGVGAAPVDLEQDSDGDGIPDYIEEQLGGLLGELEEDKAESEKEAREAAKKARERQERRLRRSYLNTLLGLGVPLTPETRQLVEQAAGRLYSQGEFLFLLRQSDFYGDLFPGILNPDGSLKMSEAQYRNLERQYRSIAGLFGLNLSDSAVGTLFEKNISLPEFRERAEAERTLLDNPIAFRQFQATLRARGIDQVSRKELQDFVLGRAPASWYKIWQETEVRTAAREAGLLIKRAGDEYGAIGRQMLLKIAGKGFSDAELREGFFQLSDALLGTRPAALALNLGVSKPEFVQAIFGGPKSAEARQKIERVMLTGQAVASRPRARGGVGIAESGGLTTTGQAERPQTQ